jgi:opacity protein-like surface antigen
MKSLLLSSLAAVAALAALPAQAQDRTPGGPYASLGYARFNSGFADLDTVQGRLGYRFGAWAGIEAEATAGLGTDTVADVIKFKLKHQESLYGVAFLPITPKLDLLGRVGYGYTGIKVSVPIPTAPDAFSFGRESWNFGAGVQYHLDGKNGVRADYTRQEFIGSNADADIWSIAYARRF